MRTLAIVALTAAVVVALDQLTKLLVRQRITAGREQIELLPFFELRHVHNTGVAFGLFAGQAVIAVIGAVFVAIVLVALVVDLPADDVPTRLAIGSVAGGAIGNLIDRARLGYVTDFLHLSHWPTFNVADCGITIGVVVLMVRMWRQPRDEVADRERSEHADAPGD